MPFDNIQTQDAQISSDEILSLSRLIRLFRYNHGHVTVSLLYQELDLQPAIVDRHVKQLQHLGYPITAEADGYRLIEFPDVLYPWEFPDRMATIHYFQEISSTMSVARTLALNACPHMTVVIAETQTQGRGRLARVWRSHAGGLYFTLVLRPQIPLEHCHFLNFLASVVLTRVIKAHCGIAIGVKWPNDVLFGHRKLSGMLSELITPPDAPPIVNIGIGLNVNNEPSEEEPMAVSLREILGRPVMRQQLLSEFLNEFEYRAASINIQNILSEWKKYTITLNRQVVIETVHGVYEGMAVDIDHEGALVLQTADGSLKTVSHGDCFLSVPDPSL